jgi:hypothetical protein
MTLHPIMGNWPANREELNRRSWEMHAPQLLTLMPAGDPGPVPAEIREDFMVWPEDEQDDDWLHPERFETNDPAAAIELAIMSLDRSDMLNTSPGRAGHRHAEPTKAVRRHLTVVR